MGEVETGPNRASIGTAEAVPSTDTTVVGRPEGTMEHHFGPVDRPTAVNTAASLNQAASTKEPFASTPAAAVRQHC